MTDYTEGLFNAAVHRLELDDGTACAVKVAPPPDVTVMRYEHYLITPEVTAKRLPADADVDLPVGADDVTSLIHRHRNIPLRTLPQALKTMLPDEMKAYSPSQEAGTISRPDPRSCREASAIAPQEVPGR